MLQAARTFSVIDSHTAGEPTRIVIGGLPRVRGTTMAELREALQRDCDDVRRALVLEPRGHAAIVAAFLLPPCDPAADLGVVFANDVGYLGMCGHGAIGVATVAVATGMVTIREPVTAVTLDTPVGAVTCCVRVEGGRPRAVAMRNVPSFLWRQRAVVAVPGHGKVAADIAWGGNWFAFVEAEQLGLEVDREHLPELMAAATAVRRAIFDAGIRGRHPLRDGDEVIDHVKLFTSLAAADGPGARALTLCPGTAYDRSPCGTGTSAKLAVLHAKGELALGERFTSASVLDTRFSARIVEETTVGGLAAIVPEIEGAAFVTGFATLIVDPEDPCGHGI